MNNYIVLDLHGEDYINTKIKANEFIMENHILGNKYLYIIHGKGKGIVKKALYEVLKEENKVLSYKIDMFNDGASIIELDIN